MAKKLGKATENQEETTKAAIQEIDEAAEAQQELDQVEIDNLLKQIIGNSKVHKASLKAGLVIVPESIALALTIAVQENMQDPERTRVYVVAEDSFSTFNKHIKFGWAVISQSVSPENYETLLTEARKLIKV